MALRRRTGQRFQASIWPGFVDAMTGLLMVLMFVLTIFTVIQFVLRDRITGQESELGSLSEELASLSRALGVERDRTANLQNRIGDLSDSLDAARAEANQSEAEVGRLQSAAEQSQARIEALLRQQQASEQELTEALAQIDLETEEKRLAIARREALEALLADVRAEAQANNRASEQAISELEAQRLVDASAAQMLRDRLQDAGAELTAMTLDLERERKEAEETLTLLAAARSAQHDAEEKLAAALLAQSQAEEALSEVSKQKFDLAAQLTEARSKAGSSEALREQLAQALSQTQQSRDTAEQSLNEALLAREQARAEIQDLRAELGEQQDLEQALAAAISSRDLAIQLADRGDQLLAEAKSQLTEESEASSAAQRQVEALSQQVAELSAQLGSLNELLNAAEQDEVLAQIEILDLDSRLNAALSRVAIEERKRAELEAAEAARLRAERDKLERYRSDFFGEVSKIVEGIDGVRVEGDRFVFSSEVLFGSGDAILSDAGKEQIAKVAATLRGISDNIPDGIDWIIRVDGHTDNQPLSGFGDFKDNWELSQARALSVVRFMSGELGIEPRRLSANGFGEFRPLVVGDSPEARAANRRIELKLTER